ERKGGRSTSLPSLLDGGNVADFQIPGPQERGPANRAPSWNTLRPVSAARGVVHRDGPRAVVGTGVADLVGRAAGAEGFGGEGVDVAAAVGGGRDHFAVEQHVDLLALATGPGERYADALAPQREHVLGGQVLRTDSTTTAFTVVGGGQRDARGRIVAVDADEPLACRRRLEVAGFVVAIQVGTAVVVRIRRQLAEPHVQVGVTGAASHRDVQGGGVLRDVDEVVQVFTRIDVDAPDRDPVVELGRRRRRRRLVAVVGTRQVVAVRGAVCLDADVPGAGLRVGEAAVLGDGAAGPRTAVVLAAGRCLAIADVDVRVAGSTGARNHVEREAALSLGDFEGIELLVAGGHLADLDGDAVLELGRRR